MEYNDRWFRTSPTHLKAISFFIRFYGNSIAKETCLEQLDMLYGGNWAVALVHILDRN